MSKSPFHASPNPALPHQVILASAGSGKTYQLTSKLLRLLLTGEEPSSILATTFTRKAAGEILAKTIARLLDAMGDANKCDDLQTAIGGDVPISPERCQAVLATMGRSLDRMSIYTLDSFFAQLIGAFRFELGLPTEPSYIDDGSLQARELRFSAIDQLLQEEAEADQSLATLSALLKQLHHDAAQRSITQALDRIVQGFYEVYQEVPSEQAWQGVASEGLLSDEDLTLAIARLKQAGDWLPSDKRFAKAWTSDVLKAESADRLVWAQWTTSGLAKVVAEGLEAYYKKPVPPEVIEAYQPLVDHSRASAGAILSFQTQATWTLLHYFHQRFKALREQAGVLRFADATHALAYDLFELDEMSLADAMFRIDASVTHILLDEFQDTSISQWKVLQPFTEEASSQDRSLFCVGDKKQAIYGWRGGCEQLFEQVIALPGIGPEHVAQMSKSYRSSQVVLDSVNQVFESLTSNPVLDQQANSAKQFESQFDQHIAADKQLPGHVTLMTTAHDIDPDSTDSDEDSEATTVEASAHLLIVVDHIEARYHQAPHQTIGVLCRGNKDLPLLIYLLRKRGLPATSEGGAPLTDSAAVNVFLSALSLAEHPDHSAAAFHVANSPLGQALGLTTTDRRDVLTFSNRLRQSLIDQGLGKTLANWAHRVRPVCSERSAARLDVLIDLAHEWQQQAGPTASLEPRRFVMHAKATRTDQAADTAIRVMTIHKSKGLEFDTVVLPELDRAFSFKPTFLLDRPLPTEAPTAVYRAGDSKLRDAIPELTELATKQQEAEITEWLCLLYVAMTRAKHALHMLVKPLSLTKQGKLSKQGINNLSYAALLRHALAQEDVRETLDEHAVLFELGTHDWHREVNWPVTEKATLIEQDVEVIEKSLSLGPASEHGRVLPTLSASQLNPQPVRVADMFAHPESAQESIRQETQGIALVSELSPRQYGLAIHAMFEAVGFIDDPIPNREVLIDLAKRDVPGADKSQLAELADTLIDWLKNPPADLARALDRHDATELFYELPFAHLNDQGKLISGRFDRLTVTRDSGGKALDAQLIDFKTETWDPNDPEDLAQRVAHHRPQMEAYRQAAAALFGLSKDKVRAGLLFTQPIKFVEID